MAERIWDKTAQYTREGKPEVELTLGEWATDNGFILGHSFHADNGDLEVILIQTYGGDDRPDTYHQVFDSVPSGKYLIDMRLFDENDKEMTVEDLETTYHGESERWFLERLE